MKGIALGAAALLLTTTAAHSDSNLFTGTSFYGSANPYTQNGCCGYFEQSIAGNGMGPSGNTFVSNYYRTVVIYMLPDAPGWFTLNVALSDWNGAFNKYQDNINPTYGNRVIAYTDPIPWLGFGNKIIISAQWDMHYRSVSFFINRIPVNTNYSINTGPNASFEVNYAQAVVWSYGADSQLMALYNWDIAKSFLGCCGQPQASDEFVFHLWDNGYNGHAWDYGPAVYTFNQRGSPGTVTNYYPLNLYGWEGAFQFGNQFYNSDVNCCVTFEDLTLQ